MLMPTHHLPTTPSPLRQELAAQLERYEDLARHLGPEALDRLGQVRAVTEAAVVADPKACLHKCRVLSEEILGRTAELVGGPACDAPRTLGTPSVVGRIQQGIGRTPGLELAATAASLASNRGVHRGDAQGLIGLALAGLAGLCEALTPAFGLPVRAVVSLPQGLDVALGAALAAARSAGLAWSLDLDQLLTASRSGSLDWALFAAYRAAWQILIRTRMRALGDQSTKSGMEMSRAVKELENQGPPIGQLVPFYVMHHVGTIVHQQVESPIRRVGAVPWWVTQIAACAVIAVSEWERTAPKPAPPEDEPSAETRWDPEQDTRLDPVAELRQTLRRYVVFVARKHTADQTAFDLEVAGGHQQMERLLRGRPVEPTYGALHNYAAAAGMLSREGNQVRVEALIEVREASIKEVQERRKLMAADTEAGRELRTLYAEHAARMEMVDRWRSIVKRHILVLSGSDRLRAHLAMQDIYFQAAVHWSRSQMRLFVESDFEKDLWVNIVDRAQDSVPVGKKTHLHHANVFLGHRLGARLRLQRERAWRAQHLPLSSRGQPRGVLRVVEGGVGGANTTHKVLEGILAACREDCPYAGVEYRGFEVNRAFVVQTESIVRGSYGTGPRGEEQDPRASWFLGLHRRKGFSFSTLANHEHYVVNTDMGDGVAELAEQMIREERERIDLFFCSYAFHHLPNGRALRTFLGGQQEHELNRLDARTDRGQRVLRQLIGVLDLVGQGRLEDAQGCLAGGHLDPAARALVELLPLAALGPGGAGELDRHELLRTLRARLESPPGSEPLLPPAFVAAWTIDHQQILLHRIHSIMREDGLVAIADPDGFSLYNQLNLAGNAEMGVAHFLPLRQLIELLQSVGFVVERDDAWIQVKVRDQSRVSDEGPFYAVPARGVDGVSSDSAVEDSNLGYMVIARKPRAEERTHLYHRTLFH